MAWMRAESRGPVIFLVAGPPGEIDPARRLAGGMGEGAGAWVRRPPPVHRKNATPPGAGFPRGGLGFIVILEVRQHRFTPTWGDRFLESGCGRSAAARYGG